MGFEGPSKSGLSPHDEAILRELMTGVPKTKEVEEVRNTPPEMGDQLEKLRIEEKEENERNVTLGEIKEDAKPKELLN